MKLETSIQEWLEQLKKLHIYLLSDAASSPA